MNIDQKLFLMIRKHKITTIASWNYQHLYIYLTYRAKALSNDWETQHSKNCKLKLSLFLQTEEHHHHLSKKLKNFKTVQQDIKNARITRTTTSWHISNNYVTQHNKYSRLKQPTPVYTSQTISPPPFEKAQKAQKYQKKIKNARITWTHTSWNIDQKLFLMNMKHKIPETASWLGNTT